MIDVLSREFIYFRYYFGILVRQIAPYWAVGIVLGSVISVFGKEKIHRAFVRMSSNRLGAFGVIPASLLGMASPICMYGTIPIAATFSQKGMSDDLLASFMMSSILLNPQLLIYSAALGKTVLIIRVVSCFVCGVIAGLCVRFFFKGRSFFNFSGLNEKNDGKMEKNSFIKLLKSIWRNIRVTGPYFLLGIVLTVLFQRYVPSNAFASLFGNQRGFGVLMAATLGVPLYICGGGTIPLLMEWLRHGMSMGSAAAFMITGPATKLTNLGAVKIVLGAKRFILFLLFAIVYAVATGIIVDLIHRLVA